MPYSLRLKTLDLNNSPSFRNKLRYITLFGNMGSSYSLVLINEAIQECKLQYTFSSDSKNLILLNRCKISKLMYGNHFYLNMKILCIGKKNFI